MFIFLTSKHYFTSKKELNKTTLTQHSKMAGERTNQIKL